MLNQVLHTDCESMLSQMHMNGRQFDLCYADHVFDDKSDKQLKWIGSLKAVAKPTATLYIHTDQRADIQVMDVAKNYGWKLRSRIVWSYNWGGRPRNLWAPKHDDILMFTAGDEWTFNAESVSIPKATLINSKKDWQIPTDVWVDIPILHTMSKEKDAGEHLVWQKPEKLLERIIKASSNRGDLVIDIFGGTGTTAVVAKRLGRDFIICDTDAECVRVMKKRIVSV
jgi:DNA modification methylase